MQNIQLNIIPFKPLVDKKIFAFYPERKQGFISIHWNKLFEELPINQQPQDQFFYSNFQPATSEAIEKEVEFSKAINFSKHYFSYLILNHFKSITGAIVFPNFINDVEVWFEDTTIKNNTYKQYHKYSLKVQYNNIVANTFELLVAYNGTSKITKTNVADWVELDTEKLSLVEYNGTIYSYKKSTEFLLPHQTKLYPILNYHLKKELNIKEEPKIENRFPIFLNLLNSFCNQYIYTKSFKSIFKLQADSFYNIPNENVHYTKSKANELQFKDGKHFNPGWGILKFKPFKPANYPTIKLFFIYNKADGDFVKAHLYDVMVKGWEGKIKNEIKKADPLNKYINQPISFDANKQISFTDNNTIFEEVREKIDAITFNPEIKYIAIYVSPIAKTEKDHPQHKAYYKIKELLLNKSISSQVVYKEHLNKKDFYYFIPNIYVALLAKMGGIPWRLSSTNEDELIVGVGAFKPKDSPYRYVGSAFCFSNEGVFENFDCFKSNEPNMLAGSIRNAIEIFKQNKRTAKRLIIHFYKEISNKEELEPILKMLDELGEPNLPVIIVTVNKTDSRELIGFDLNSNDKMPMSGTYIKVAPNKFLLFNNTRYNNTSKLSTKDYHFPIKLSFKSSQPEILTANLMAELINQVYQFSRVYWKSISQQNLPVTTIYPEMVAEIFPHFEVKNLPEFAKKNLWFL